MAPTANRATLAVPMSRPALALALLFLTASGPVSHAQTSPPGREAPHPFASDAAQGGASQSPRLEHLRRELVQLGREQQTGESVADAWRQKLLELNAHQIDLDRRMGANRDSLVQLMAALQTFRRNPPPALLVNPRSARDAVRAAILMRAVLPELEARRRLYVQEATELNRIRRDAAVAGAALISAASADADRRNRIDQLVSAKTGLEQPQDPAAVERARQAAARASSMGELIGDLAHAETTAPKAADTGNGPVHLDPPVHGKLIRRFGMTSSASAADARRSTGVTWRTEPAATVLSPANAVVDYAGPVKGVGLVIILRISNDLRVVMAGLDRVSALTGRTLVAGEPVGRMPQAGAPELFLELRRAEQPVNPAAWMKP